MFLDAEEKGELLLAAWTSIVVAGHLISLPFLIIFQNRILTAEAPGTQRNKPPE
jgi:hypothetical protein